MKQENNKKEIFKLQIPVYMSGEEPIALVYNQSRKVCKDMRMTPAVSKFMGRKFKKFVYGIANSNGGVDLDLSEDAPWQEW